MQKSKCNGLIITPLDYREYFEFGDKTNTEKDCDYVIGDMYTTQGTQCDGFDMPIKTYLLVGYIKKFGDVDVNALVMKQVGGEVGTTYSLSKNDCSLLGIEYTEGLQLFPMDMKFNHVEDKRPYDPYDMSTNPTDCDGLIHHVLFKIHGFYQLCVRGLIETPFGETTLECLVAASLQVKCKLSQFMSIRASVTPRISKDIAYGNYLYVSCDGEMYVLLTLDEGIEPCALKGVRLTDLITIGWCDKPRNAFQELQLMLAKQELLIKKNEY